MFIETDIENPFNKKYVVYEKINQGTFGSVFKGVNTENKINVAIKQVDLSIDMNLEDEKYQKQVIEKQHLRYDTLNEIKILNMLNNKISCVSNFIDVYESKNSKNEYIYIVMEQYEKSLKEIYDERVHIKEEQITQWFREVRDCLKLMHENNIFHRDIKLENIMIDKNNIAKIIDFNVSIILKDDHTILSLCGTKRYFSKALINSNEGRIKTFDGKRKTLIIQDYWSLICSFFLLYNKQYLVEGDTWFKLRENLLKNNFTIFVPYDKFLEFIQTCLKCIKNSDNVGFIQTINNF